MINYLSNKGISKPKVRLILVLSSTLYSGRFGRQRVIRGPDGFYMTISATLQHDFPGKIIPAANAFI